MRPSKNGAGTGGRGTYVYPRVEVAADPRDNAVGLTRRVENPIVLAKPASVRYPRAAALSALSALSFLGCARTTVGVADPVALRVASLRAAASTSSTGTGGRTPMKTDWPGFASIGWRATVRAGSNGVATAPNVSVGRKM